MGPDVRRSLGDIIASSFRPIEVRRWLETLGLTPTEIAALPAGNASMLEVSLEAISLLERLGNWDDCAIVASLLRERSANPDLVALARRAGVDGQQYLARVFPNDAWRQRKEDAGPQLEEYVHRKREEQLVLDSLQQQESVVVLGDAGTGKSTLLSFLAVRLYETAGYVPVVLRLQRSTQDPTGFSRLPDVGRIGTYRDAQVVLIIDTLDLLVMRGSVAHLRALVEPAVGARRALMLVSCRTREYQALGSAFMGGARRVLLGDFTERERETAVNLYRTKYGKPSLSVPISLAYVCSRPLHLRMFAEIFRDDTSFEDMNVYRLFQMYWSQRIETLDLARVDGELGQQGMLRARVVNEAVELMNDTHELRVRVADIQERIPEVNNSGLQSVVHQLVSDGVLQADGSRISLFHQRLLDFCNARNALRRIVETQSWWSIAPLMEDRWYSDALQLLVPMLPAPDELIGYLLTHQRYRVASLAISGILGDRAYWLDELFERVGRRLDAAGTEELLDILAALEIAKQEAPEPVLDLGSRILLNGDNLDAIYTAALLVASYTNSSAAKVLLSALHRSSLDIAKRAHITFCMTRYETFSTSLAYDMALHGIANLQGQNEASVRICSALLIIDVVVRLKSSEQQRAASLLDQLRALETHDSVSVRYLIAYVLAEIKTEGSLAAHKLAQSYLGVCEIHSRTIPDRIEGDSRHASPVVRRCAVHLSKWLDPGKLPDWSIRLISDPEPLVRMGVAATLCEVAPAIAFERVLFAIHDDSDSHVRTILLGAAIEILSKLGSPPRKRAQFVRSLRRVITESSDLQLRRDALSLLGAVGYEEDRVFVHTLMDQPALQETALYAAFLLDRASLEKGERDRLVGRLS